MSAKKARKNTRAPMAPMVAAQPVAASGPAPELSSAAAPAAAVAWIDSDNPRRRMIGKIVLIAVWVYVAALWLLALDQWFHWGIFGPKVPPIP